MGTFKGKVSVPDEETLDFAGMFVFDRAVHSAASRNQRKPQRHGEHRENTEILGRFALPAVFVTSMRLRAQSRECHVGSSFPDRHRPLQVSNCLRPKTTGVGRNPSLCLSSIRDLCASVVCQNRRAPQRNHQLVVQWDGAEAARWAGHPELHPGTGAGTTELAGQARATAASLCEPAAPAR